MEVIFQFIAITLDAINDVKKFQFKLWHINTL